MKKLLVVAAAVMAAAPAAMASKARVNALSGGTAAPSRQIVDIQTAFDRPYQFMQLDTQATIEWGASSSDFSSLAAGQRHAEAGFLMRSEEQAYGVYLGRRSDAFNGAVQGAVGQGLATTALLEQNPINVFYATKMGEWTFGGNLKYANGKRGDDKSSSMGIALGAAMGAWEFELVQGLSGESKLANGDKVESKGMTQLGASFFINDTMEAYATYQTVKADSEIGGNSATAFERTNLEVGFVNTIAKTEEANVFYGVAYRNTEDKVADSKGSYLPVWIGVEANASSWLVVRGSVRQNILLNEEDVAGTKRDLDSIGFQAGLGLKLGKGMLDANFGTAQAGHLSFSDGGAGNEFLSNVAYTHWF